MTVLANINEFKKNYRKLSDSERSEQLEYIIESYFFASEQDKNHIVSFFCNKEVLGFNRQYVEKLLLIAKKERNQIDFLHDAFERAYLSFKWSLYGIWKIDIQFEAVEITKRFLEKTLEYINEKFYNNKYIKGFSHSPHAIHPRLEINTKNLTKEESDELLLIGVSVFFSEETNKDSCLFSSEIKNIFKAALETLNELNFFSVKRKIELEALLLLEIGEKPDIGSSLKNPALLELNKYVKNEEISKITFGKIPEKANYY